MTEEQAVEIARAEVAERGWNVDEATFTATQDETGWTVLVQRQPLVPGGHSFIYISSTGEVTRYQPGA